MKNKLLLLIIVVLTVFAMNSVVLAGEWQYKDSKWFYLIDGNELKSSWKEIDGKWYYFHADGQMAYGAWIGNYYLGKDGAMLKSTYTPDGYWVEEDGTWDGKPENNIKNYYLKLYKQVIDEFKVYSKLSIGSRSGFKNQYLGYITDIYEYSEKKLEFGYFFRDINNNGDLELLITTHGDEGILILGIYSLVEKNGIKIPHVLYTAQYRYDFTLLEDNRIVTWGSVGHYDKTETIEIVLADNKSIRVLEESRGEYPYLKTRGNTKEVIVQEFVPIP